MAQTPFMRTVRFRWKMFTRDYETELEIPDLGLMFPLWGQTRPELVKEVCEYCAANGLHVEHWYGGRHHGHPVDIIVCKNVGDQVILKTVFPDLR